MRAVAPAVHLMWHPAALLISWLGFALLLQWLPFHLLLLCAGVALTAAFIHARERSRRLIWRSRWLLISLAVLFLLFTPGEFLPGFWGKLGATREGLWHAGEQLARLLAMLASLALMHDRLGTPGLLAGFYALLAPFGWRERTVVRLMLVLECIENAPRADWRAWLRPTAGWRGLSDQVSLPLSRFRGHDFALVAAIVVLVLLVAVKA